MEYDIKFKENYYNKKDTANNSLQTPPNHIKHTYLTILAMLEAVV